MRVTKNTLKKKYHTPQLHKHGTLKVVTQVTWQFNGQCQTDQNYDSSKQQCDAGFNCEPW
jgi:hypothetical protein